MATKIELKKRTLDYIVYKMVLWYIEYKKIKSRDEFNQMNDFTERKIRTLPFIICMCSKDRETMFGIFDNFIALSNHGMIEKDLVEYPVQYDPSDYFKKLKLAKDWSLLSHPDNLLEGNYFDSGTHKISISKKDFCVEGVPYHIIDEAIEHLKRRNIHFTILDSNWLRAWNGYHICYQAFRSHEGNKVPLNMLLKEKSIFSPQAHLFAWC